MRSRSLTPGYGEPWAPVSAGDGGWRPPGCCRCGANLDLAVSDWMAGIDLMARHPRFWHHVSICARCRDGLLDVLDLLSDEAGVGLAPVYPRQLVAVDRAWLL